VRDGPRASAQHAARNYRIEKIGALSKWLHSKIDLKRDEHCNLLLPSSDHPWAGSNVSPISGQLPTVILGNIRKSATVSIRDLRRITDHVGRLIFALLAGASSQTGPHRLENVCGTRATAMQPPY
jgi:hypothetical protein